jgi:hypothetical protein
MEVKPSVPGRRVCMQCGKRFYSQDVKRIRRCDRCKRNEDRLPARALHVVDLEGLLRRRLD